MASKKRIIFKASVFYFQEQNRISKCMVKIIIDMTWAIILKSNFDNDSWLEVILAMTYVKNVWLITILEENNPYLTRNNANPNI